MKLQNLTVAGIILAATCARLIPHPPNVTPIIALGLFGGAYFSDRRLALIIPLLAMLVSDLFLGFHGTLLWVYGGIVIAVLLGRALAGKRQTTWVAGATIMSSLLFFLVTNFGVWITGTGFHHPLTSGGLMLTYIDGLPFLRNALLGDLVYAAVLFGGFEYLIHRVPALAPQPGK